MAEMAIMLRGVATSNEGDAYTWSVICCLIINEFRIYNIYSIFSGKNPSQFPGWVKKNSPTIARLLGFQSPTSHTA
jgi:TRAP-type mannitol/chloroaromatic compound transport system substrate-binding protein